MTTTYVVWRTSDGSEEETRRRFSIGQDFSARGRITEAARRAAAEDHALDGWEWTWPVAYTVRDTTTGKLWVVEVDREMVPEFWCGTPKELPMPPAVHALWGGRAMCGDPRLAGVPGNWPAEQTWIALPDLRTSPDLFAKVSCERCQKLARSTVAGLEQIGAGS